MDPKSELKNRFVPAPKATIWEPEHHFTDYEMTPDVLQFLMLASIGLFIQDADGRFRNTALSEHLRDDHPHSMRGLALMYGAPWTWTPYISTRPRIECG